jgi:D-alanyl-D-alanine carboxypeptidase
VVAAVVDGELVPLAREVALPPEALFPVYSVTKTLVAAAVMLLVERGSVRLDQPVGELLPELGLPPQVTVRRLLNHTAGLPDYGGLPEYAAAVRSHPGRPWSREDFLAVLRGRGLSQAPGEGWAYSNLGYLCLRMVLERIHGGPLSRVLRSELFDPVGLTRTRVANTAADMEGVEVAQHYHPGWVAHGLVLSTAGELALLLDALLAGPLLAAGTVAAMTQPVVLPFRHPLFARPGYGLGLMVDAGAPGLVAGHGGEGPGYSVGALLLRDVGGPTVTVVAAVVTETPDSGLALALEAAGLLRSGSPPR